jgi:uncharacterized protein YjiS (DUF1127 family)
MTAMHDVQPASGVAQRVGAALAGLGQRLRTKLDDARERAALRAELAQLERVGELDHVLNDLGLSRGGIPLLVQNHPRSARLLAGMMQRIGIAAPKDPLIRARLHTQLTEIRQQCLMCTETRRCERWLRSGETHGQGAFCPNTPAFARLRVAMRLEEHAAGTKRA